MARWPRPVAARAGLPAGPQQLAAALLDLGAVDGKGAEQHESADLDVRSGGSAAA
jgi:hypothetical protein